MDELEQVLTVAALLETQMQSPLADLTARRWEGQSISVFVALTFRAPRLDMTTSSVLSDTNLFMFHSVRQAQGMYMWTSLKLSSLRLAVQGGPHNSAHLIALIMPTKRLG